MTKNLVELIGAVSIVNSIIVPLWIASPTNGAGIFSIAARFSSGKDCGIFPSGGFATSRMRIFTELLVLRELSELPFQDLLSELEFRYQFPVRVLARVLYSTRLLLLLLPLHEHQLPEQQRL